MSSYAGYIGSIGPVGPVGKPVPTGLSRENIRKIRIKRSIDIIDNGYDGEKSDMRNSIYEKHPYFNPSYATIYGSGSQGMSGPVGSPGYYKKPNSIIAYKQKSLVKKSKQKSYIRK